MRSVAIAFVFALFVGCCCAYPPVEQVHLAVTGFPEEMAVSWVTDGSDGTPTSVCQHGSSINSFTEQSSGKSFTFTDGGVLHRNITIHNVIMTRIGTEGVRYYRCGDPTHGWSQVFSFRPFPKFPSPVDIIVYGDLGVENAQSFVDIQNEVLEQKTDMILHVGDFAYDLHDDNGRVGDTFMNMIQPVSAFMPYMGCLGNHEAAYNFSHWTNRFSLISGFRGNSNNNWWFSWEVSYAHFVAISTEVYFHDDLIGQVKAQYEWLERDLKVAVMNRNFVPWIIVYGHRPLYCSNVDDIPDCTLDAQRVRKGINGQYGIEELLYKYKVDMYIAGHEHSYERTYPVYDGQHIDKQENHTYVDPAYPFYIISGSAGCKEGLDYYDSVFYGPWSVVRSASYGYGHLNIINGTHLHWRQLLNEGNSGEDELWVSKKPVRPQQDDVINTAPPLSTSKCDSYCFAVCQKGKNSIDNCREKCNCIDSEPNEFVVANTRAKKDRVRRH